MTRGLHRAPSRLSRILNQRPTQRFLTRWLIGAILILALAGLVQAFSVARHQDQQPSEPTAPVISAPLTSMPRVIR